jgi:hypothetical protein
MKRFLKIFGVSLVSLFVVLLTTLLAAVRFPQWYFREAWVVSLLRKQDFAKDWSWERLSVGLSSPAFLEYRVSVETEALDADYEGDAFRVLVKDADLRVHARVKYSFFSGLSVLPISPLKIRLKDAVFVTKESPSPDETKARPLEPLRWKELVREIQRSSLPDIDLSVGRFALESRSLESVLTPTLSVSKLSGRYENSTLTLSTALDLHLAQSPPLDVVLKLTEKELKLQATAPKLSVLQSLKCEVSVGNLAEIEKPSPLALACDTRLVSPPLVSKVQGPSLPLALKLGAQLSHDLGDPAFRDVSFDLRSPNPTWNFLVDFSAPVVSLDRILVAPARAVEELLPHAKAEIVIPKLKAFLKTFPPGYDSAPAPLSAMDGPIELKIASSLESGKLVTRAHFATHLRGAEQQLKLRVEGHVPWDTRNTTRPAPGALEIALFIDQFRLMLPRVSIREPLPALIGDSRIQHGDPKPEKKKSQAPALPDWSLAIKTESPVAFKTSLLKEEFKFLLDLVIGPDGPRQGSVSLLPMRAEILRRPIEVQNFSMNWQPEQEPTLVGRLRFPLPEYEIFLRVEGPLSQPRTLFESSPPLDTNDIYAVLLFGRPMSELDPEGRQGIGRVQQGLAQGFFSLSTLYLLAGSRIESLGFDPNTNDVTAQLRLDRRHTLRVGTQDGQGSVAIRRSLGKGWFIESSAQDSSRAGELNTNFGLLLQRIIAY